MYVLGVGGWRFRVMVNAYIHRLKFLLYLFCRVGVSKNDFEGVGSLSHIGARDWTQAIRLGGKHL